MTPTPTKRPKLLIAMVVLLGLCGLNAAIQAIMVGVGVWNDTSPLPYIQAVIAAIGLGGAVGAWKLREWSAWAAVAYGIVTGAMVSQLPRWVEMPEEAVKGLTFSAIVIVLVGVGMAWGIRVGIRRASEKTAT